MPVLDCPKCGGQLQTPGDVAGRRVRCPHCEAVFRAGGAPTTSRQPSPPREVKEEAPASSAFDEMFEEEDSRQRRSRRRRRVDDEEERSNRRSPRRPKPEEDDYDEDEDEEDLDDQTRMKLRRAERRELSGRLEQTSKAMQFCSIGLLMYALAPNVLLFSLFVTFFGIPVLHVGVLGYLAFFGIGWLLLGISTIFTILGDKRNGAMVLGIAAGLMTIIPLAMIPMLIALTAVDPESPVGRIASTFARGTGGPAGCELVRLILLMLYIRAVAISLKKPDLARRALRVAFCVPGYAVGFAIFTGLVYFMNQDSFGGTPGELPPGASVFFGVYLLSMVETFAALMFFGFKTARDAQWEAEDAS